MTNRVLDESRGLSFDDVKEAGSDVLDFFGGITQQEAAAKNIDTTTLPREDQIAILVDGSTPSILGASPWHIGKQLDASVASQIHAGNGSTLVFGVQANLFDLAESKVRAVRYALVWDDTVVSETGTLDLDLVGQTFLIVGVNNEVNGHTLTMWITDPDIQVTLLQQGNLKDIESIRQQVIGKIGAAGKTDGNPVTDIVNKVAGFMTVSQIGGVVALAVIGVVLVLVVRSESFKDIAKTAASAAKGI